MSYSTIWATACDCRAAATIAAAFRRDPFPPVSQTAVGCAASFAISAASAVLPVWRHAASCIAADEFGFTHSLSPASGSD
jgi:hypothetical protein